MFERLSLIEAVRLERSLRGASSSVIAEADDGFKYVVKWRQDRWGTRVAFREAFGTCVFAALGILVPIWKPIYLSEALIEADQHRCLDQLGNGARIQPGVHFASRCVSEDIEDLYRTLPGDWYGRIRNRADFWGGFVVDIWLNSSRPRQSLFMRGRNDSEFMAVFVSHTGVSFAPFPDRFQPKNACFYPDMRAYPRADAIDLINLWIDKIRRNGERAVMSALNAIPFAWTTTSSPELGAQVVDRISTLQARVFEALSADMEWKCTKPPQPVVSSHLHLVPFSVSAQQKIAERNYTPHVL
jgi:hypothetical protein